MDWPPDLMAFVPFAVAMAITPGPNNIMISTAGANHGVRATMPHLAGVNLGFGAMLLTVGLGLAGPLATWPALHAAMRWVGAAWIVWMAWGMVRSAPGQASGTAAPPMGFVAAALFQWVNPKAWVIAVATATTYTAPELDLPQQVVVLATVCTVVGAPCTLVWLLLGAQAGRLLRSPGRLRAFNAVMAGLLVLSVVPIVVG